MFIFPFTFIQRDERYIEDVDYEEVEETTEDNLNNDNNLTETNLDD